MATIRRAYDLPQINNSSHSSSVVPLKQFEGSERLTSPNSFQQPEPFVDAEKAGEFLSLRPRRVLELAREGLIPAYPIGAGKRKVWRFKLSDLAHSISSCLQGE